MELREFIKETLTQIVEGIREAQDATKESGAIISPLKITESGYSIGQYQRGYKSEDKVTHYVEFETNLVETETENKKGGIGVFLPKISIGLEKEKGGSLTSLSKIKFAIPIIYPTRK